VAAFDDLGDEIGRGVLAIIRGEIGEPDPLSGFPGASFDLSGISAVRARAAARQSAGSSLTSKAV
jgi:hypothetical protein